MLSDDPFCVRHGVPFDAFEGCWRCASDAAEREKAKREVSNEKDAEIARLRAELAKSNDARDDDAMTFGNALDRQRAEIDQLSLLLSESREDAARLRAEVARLECVEGLKGDVITRYEAENAHLRAEVARLEAGRLKPETAFELRALLITFPTDVYEAEVDDFFRCYPEEV